MARAIEKGATYLDKLCHKFYDEPKGRGKKTDYVIVVFAQVGEYTGINGIKEISGMVYERLN